MSHYNHEYYLRTKEKTRADRIARAKKWALANPEKARENSRRITMKKRLVIREAKNKPCMDCGIKYPPYVMEFDHRNPQEKVNKVSRVEKFTMEKLLAEIAKCDVVCANCHAERTHRQCLARLIYPYKRDENEK